MMIVLSWTHRAVLSYCLERPGRPVDARTISAVIGEGLRAVEQACDEWVQEEVLEKLGPEDVPHARFQVAEHNARRARAILAEKS